MQERFLLDASFRSARQMRVFGTTLKYLVCLEAVEKWQVEPQTIKKVRRREEKYLSYDTYGEKFGAARDFLGRPVQIIISQDSQKWARGTTLLIPSCKQMDK